MIICFYSKPICEEKLITFIGYMNGVMEHTEHPETCFKDTFFHPELYKEVEVIPEFHGKIRRNGSFVKGCSEKAQSLGVRVFGVTEGGGCWASKTGFHNFRRFRRFIRIGSNCAAGVGGPGEIAFYTLRKFSMLPTFIYCIKLSFITFV